MRELNPAVLWQQLDQILFNFHWLFVLRQVKPLCDPLHVRINDNPRSDSVGHSQNYVRSFAGRTGDFRSNSSILRRDFAFVKRSSNLFAAPMSERRLLLKNPRRPNILRQLVLRSRRHGFQRLDTF